MPKQRGRRSAAAEATPRIAGQQLLIKPPTGASAQERKAFLTLVASVPAAHFRISDADLILSYVRAVALADKLYRQAMAGDGKAQSQWCTATRVTASLASKLRLAPSSRTIPETAGRRAAKEGISMADYLASLDSANAS